MKHRTIAAKLLQLARLYQLLSSHTPLGIRLRLASMTYNFLPAAEKPASTSVNFYMCTPSFSVYIALTGAQESIVSNNTVLTTTSHKAKQRQLT